LTPTRLITEQQQQTLDALLKDCLQQRWRRLVWLTGSHADCLATAAEIVQQIDPDTIWVSDLAPVGAASIGAHKAQSLLGREIPALVFDAHIRFDPDAIAAACGAVRAGGIALLLTPNAVEWPDGPDLDKARIAVHPYKPEQIGSRFVRRLILRLGQDRQVIRTGNSLGLQRRVEIYPHRRPRC